MPTIIHCGSGAANLPMKWRTSVPNNSLRKLSSPTKVKLKPPRTSYTRLKATKSEATSGKTESSKITSTAGKRNMFLAESSHHLVNRCSQFKGLGSDSC